MKNQSTPISNSRSQLSRTMARMRARRTTRFEWKATAGRVALEETPGSKGRCSGLGMALGLIFKPRAKAPKCLSLPDRLGDVVAVGVAVRLDHDRVALFQVIRGCVTARASANRKIFHHVEPNAAIAVLRIAEKQLR